MNGDNGDTTLATTVRVQADGDNILPEPGDEFVLTPYVQEITERALAYLKAGCPVHFAFAGVGTGTDSIEAIGEFGSPGQVSPASLVRATGLSLSSVRG